MALWVFSPTKKRERPRWIVVIEWVGVGQPLKSEESRRREEREEEDDDDEKERV